MSLNKVMHQGRAALSANQIGLATVSHNIANVNTEGFSRQRVDLTTADPTSHAGFRLGSGVRVANVSRSASEFLNRRLEDESTIMGKVEGTSEVLSQIETIFQDDGNEGLSATMSRFFNDVRSLSTQPESLPLRVAVRESANTVSTKFQSLMTGVDQIRTDIDRRVEGAIVDINMLAKRVGELNRRIMEVESTGASANDERDQRDLALRHLSKIVNVQVTPIENGGINVSAGRLGVLVNGVEASEFRSVIDKVDGGQAQMRIRQVGSSGNLTRDVTDFIDNGSLGGYLHVRDTSIPATVAKLNSIAFNLAKEVNTVHREAYGMKGQKGFNFFEPMETSENAASVLKISGDIKEEAGNIGGAYKMHSAGDNRALLDIADLQDKKVFRGEATFTDQASSLVGDIGVELKGITDNVETQRNLIDQLNVAREKIAGVSLDEETINLLQYQKAFDASAKMIQVADNLMDTVLSLKRF